MDSLVGQWLGNYQIVELVGKGGMAAVYKGYQSSMNRYVAVKVMSQQYSGEDEFVQRFQNEAQLIAQLEHAHILPVYDFGQMEGMLYIAMRFLPTGTLEDRITAEGMGIGKAKRIFTQIAGALAYAHGRGVVHRDLKPANILVDEQGNAFLSDFGIAKSLEGTQNLTGTGNVVGTPVYMSPEQGLGRELDGRSDIYSLGIMLFEMLTGTPPFTATNPMAVMLKHINDPPPRPSNINPEVHREIEAVILKALAKEPSERFQSADELAEAFEAAVSYSRGELSAPPSREFEGTIQAPAAGSGSAPTLSSPVGVGTETTDERTALLAEATTPAPAVPVPHTPVTKAQLTLDKMDDIAIDMNSISSWLNRQAWLANWGQGLLLSLSVFVILNRLTQGGMAENALLSVIPGILIYGLLRAPMVGGLLAMVLLIPPLLVTAPGLAIIWVILTITAGGNLKSRELMLFMFTMAVAGHPLGLAIPLTAPWWLKTRRTVQPVALGVVFAGLFAIGMGWPNASGLLPVPTLNPDIAGSVLINQPSTSYLGLFNSAARWQQMLDIPTIDTVTRGTLRILGEIFQRTNGMLLVTAVAWAAAATLSTSNSRVDSPLLRAAGLVMGFFLLLIVHFGFHPDMLPPIEPITIVLATFAGVISYLLTQWPLQADPSAGDSTGMQLRLLRQTMGALFVTFGLGFYVTQFGDAALYPVLWIGGTAGALSMITNPWLGPALVFVSLGATLLFQSRPGVTIIIGILVAIYLAVILIFDKRRPRRWNPLGAGFILGAPGLSTAGLLPLGPIALGALEAQVPATILAVSAHVLLTSITPGITPLTVVIQVMVTLVGVLGIERLMGSQLLGTVDHKLRRLGFTTTIALLMALLYYTLGGVGLVVPIWQALLVSTISSAMFVIAMGNRALFWREFVEREEEESEADLFDDEVTGPELNSAD